jgi:hypothetical protein
LNHRPGSPVEGWAKPIGARGARLVHAANRSLDLQLTERGQESQPVDTPCFKTAECRMSQILFLTGTSRNTCKPKFQ